MIRSRDLLVFAVVVFLIVLGIGLTLLLKTSSSRATNTMTVDGVASSTFTASTETTGVDREGTIARLRKLLSQADTTNMPSPSVEEVSTDVQTATTSTQESGSIKVVVQRCAKPDDTLAASQSWPLQDTAVIVQNGTRIVVHTTVVQDDTALGHGTTTASSTLPVPTSHATLTSLLRMPEYPPVLDTPSCVPGDTIGVTQSGFLIANKDAVSYKGRGADDLIGYARDGFPIYGVYDGEVDSCGGYTKNGSYRYSIAKERSFILGCFAGLPLLFENKPL